MKLLELFLLRFIVLKQMAKDTKSSIILVPRFYIFHSLDFLSKTSCLWTFLEISLNLVAFKVQQGPDA